MPNSQRNAGISSRGWRPINQQWTRRYQARIYEPIVRVGERRGPFTTDHPESIRTLGTLSRRDRSGRSASLYDALRHGLRRSPVARVDAIHSYRCDDLDHGRISHRTPALKPIPRNGLRSVCSFRRRFRTHEYPYECIPGDVSRTLSSSVFLRLEASLGLALGTLASDFRARFGSVFVVQPWPKLTVRERSLGDPHTMVEYCTRARPGLRDSNDCNSLEGWASAASRHGKLHAHLSYRVTYYRDLQWRGCTRYDRAIPSSYGWNYGSVSRCSAKASTLYSIRCHKAVSPPAGISVNLRRPLPRASFSWRCLAK